MYSRSLIRRLITREYRSCNYATDILTTSHSSFARIALLIRLLTIRWLVLFKRRAIYKWRVRGKTLRKARVGRSMFFEVNANLRAATCRVNVANRVRWKSVSKNCHVFAMSLATSFLVFSLHVRDYGATFRRFPTVERNDAILPFH